MSPLDLMLHAGRFYALAGQWSVAAEIASRAAPYVHQKLAPAAEIDGGRRPDILAMMASDPEPEFDPMRGTTRHGRISAGDRPDDASI